jgi:DNA-binding response OmpR family regulator
MPKIIILENYPATLDAIKMIFEFEGYEVLALTGPQHLHTQISAFQPDIILIDALLGLADGRSICTELKLSVHAQIPILLMSSHLEFSNNPHLAVYWDDYIEKPFEMIAIVNRVKMLLTKKVSQD